MSNTKDLKEYLLEKDNAFLLDDINNGKTIMLSGVWGAGKTHFWQNEIEKDLSSKLKKENKTCVYVSLYGKESISEVKSSIFLEAYKNVYGEDFISKSVSKLTDVARVFWKVKNIDAFDKINQEKKENQSEELLKDGSVICLDDIERKSKKIDLNDLFGLISDLALSLKCKIIIILNSEVFQDKEAEVFKQVKEKTINKFFYFEPTIQELFKSIYGENKYQSLAKYKDDILSAIIETEELNARIYIQVLDNCLEWEVAKRLDKNIIRVLVLGTINFIINHIILTLSDNEDFKYTIMNEFPNEFWRCFDDKSDEDNSISEIEFLKYTESFIIKNENNQSIIDSNNIWFNKNRSQLKALWKYGYRLYYMDNVDKETYNSIAKFIKTGILK